MQVSVPHDHGWSFDGWPRHQKGTGPLFQPSYHRLFSSTHLFKAFLLARHVPEFKSRIRCIFFLATPHRGSEYASTLNNILAITGILSPRQYISDLTTGSASIQLINDDFGKCAHDLPIFSFFETLRTSLGVSSAIIVDKTSAVLGMCSCHFLASLFFYSRPLRISADVLAALRAGVQ